MKLAKVTPQTAQTNYATKQRISISIDIALMEYLRQKAHIEARSISNVITLLLYDAAKKNELPISRKKQPQTA